MEWAVITPSRVILFILVLARVGGIFFASPLLSNNAIPNTVKIMIVVGMTLMLMTLFPESVVKPLTTQVGLMIAIIQELTIGLILGMVANLVILGIQMGGELIGGQIGFSAAAMLDPALNNSASVVSSFFVILASLMFLQMDGHHVVMAALSKSFDILPLAHGFNLDVGRGFLEAFIKVFLIAVKLCAPFLVVMTLLNVIIALLSKLAPQMNIFFSVGLVFQPLLGLLVMMISLPLLKVLMNQLVEDLEPNLLRILAQMR